ncbi:MAG TPA: hypothetical protein VIV09_17370, partial [Pseudolabrys sp.]
AQLSKLWHRAAHDRRYGPHPRSLVALLVKERRVVILFQTSDVAAVDRQATIFRNRLPDARRLPTGEPQCIPSRP